MSGFLGTNGNLLTDITLVVQILFFIVLCAGVTVQLLASRGRPHLFHWHDKLQSPVVVLNLLFIILVMIPTFIGVASSGGGGGSWVPITHGTLGLLAEGVAIYCLLAGFKILPRKIGVLRYFMWTAFVLWTITLLFGIGVYFAFYTGGSASAEGVGEHDADLVTEHAADVVAAAPTEAVEEHAEQAIVEETVEEHAEAPVVVETEEVVAEHAEEPAATPTEEPTPASEGVGFLRFSDGEIHSDKVTLQLAGVTPPADGFVYEAWLQGEGQPSLSLGVVEVANGEINVEFVDPQGRRLLELYNGAFISAEAANDADPNPSGVIVYSGQVAPEAMAHIRHVVTAIPTTPDGEGFALNALSEVNILLQQINAQQDAVAANDLTNLHIHAETTLNILEGQNSANYGDRDGDGETYNPGDGFGLLRFGQDDGYLPSAADHAQLAADSAGASDEVKLHAEHVKIAAANAIDWAKQIAALEEQILALDNPANAADPVTQIAGLFNALLEGVDANGDGQVAPIPGEGGIRTMYQHGQLMGSIEIFAAVGVEVAPAVATPELISEHAEEPVTAPTATPAPAAATATPVPPTPTVELISEHDGG
jgi:hypothetical protein